MLYDGRNENNVMFCAKKTLKRKKHSKTLEK
jgi:hypothetical protein